MSNKKTDNNEENLEAIAKVKMLKTSPQKLNLVSKMIRNKPVKIALAQLKFSNKRIAVDVRKCLESAIANAENNYQYDIDKLFIKEAYCGKQIIMKRFRPRAKGRAAPIMKPYSNLTIILAEKLKEKEKVVKK